MGDKLQLILGLLFIWSVCSSNSTLPSTTPPQNVPVDKSEGNINRIEKLPKTDIDQKNVNTQDNHQVKFSKSAQFSKAESRKTESLMKNELEKESKDENLIKQENSEKNRDENSRSINIEKYVSPEFQNNVYTLPISSDTEKYIEDTFSHKASTKRSSEFSNFVLTTPITTFFDKRYKEVKQKLEPDYDADVHGEHEIELEDSNEDEHENADEKYDDDLQFEKFLNNSKAKPNSTLQYKETKLILKNNTVDKNSEHNNMMVEQVKTINFSSRFNDTTSYIYPSNDNLDKLETTTPKNYISTIRKPVAVTKAPNTLNNSHIFSNKIETETIKAIHSIIAELPTTKKFKNSEESTSSEQNIQENQIIPFSVTNLKAEVTETSNINNTTTTTKSESETTTINDTQATIPNKLITTTEFTINLETTEDLASEKLLTESTEYVTDETTTEVAEVSTRLITNEIATTETIDLKMSETTTEISEIATTETGDLKMNETTTETSEIVTTETSDLKSTGTTTETSEFNETTSEFVTEQTTDIGKTEQTTYMLPLKSHEMTTNTEIETTEGISRVSKGIAFESTTDDVSTEATTLEIESFNVSSALDDISVTSDDSIKLNSEDSTTTVSLTTSGNISTDGPKVTTSVTSGADPTNLTYDDRAQTPTTETVTTSVVLVHIVNVDSNHTTILPEPLIPSFSYSTPVREKSLNNGSTISEEETTTVDVTTEDVEASSGTEDAIVDNREDNKGKIAAIVISSVGALCLIILAGLLYIMRKRQKRFNFKQTCRPVNLNEYSVDNVSIHNSVRRKGVLRTSKRSYGNPAFDDPVVVSRPLNFPQLAKFSIAIEDIKAEFEEIPQIVARISELPEGCEIKNRYANVIPLPETRVFLNVIDGHPNSDYINANYVTGPKNVKGYYIACQAPMRNTVDDFWRMIWEQQSKVILMITHLFENGVEKCVDYLPPSEVLDCHRMFGDFQVTLKKRDIKEKYIISSLQLKNMVSNSWREVTHFLYLGWPEKGVPSEVNSLIAFLIEARSFMKSSTLDKGTAANGNMNNGSDYAVVNPVVVHCSPGTGRTGVVIACDIAIREFEQTRNVDIPKIVYRIRRDRASAVQTKEQYAFIYKVVSLYASKLTGGALDSF